MRHTCFLVRYGEAILAVLYQKNAGEGAQLLGCDLCYDSGCGAQRANAPHAHVPDGAFGPPRYYAPDDVERAWLRFREGRLPEIGAIRWELWNENDLPRVLYFEAAPIII